MVTKPEPNNSIWKILIVSSFVMLSMMTWATSPLQKLAEKVQHKEEIKAKIKVCSEIRAMMPVYEEWVGRLFISGCLWELRNVMLTLDPSKEKEIRKQFQDQEGLEYEKYANDCAEGAAANQLQNKISERVVAPLYLEHLKCPDIYDEAKKLGLEEE